MTIVTAYTVVARYSYGPISLWPYIVMGWVVVVAHTHIVVAYIVMTLYTYGPMESWVMYLWLLITIQSWPI